MDTEQLQQFCSRLKADDGKLMLEGVNLADVIESTGGPVYVYTRQGFLDSLGAYRSALNSADIEHTICYSVKSCSNMAILKFIAAEGYGFDVVSGGELTRALKAGCSPENIVFAGVGKTDDEIAAAIDSNILLFNCESSAEVERISQIAESRGRRAAVSLRLNPDIRVDTHDYIQTAGKENKFGIPVDQADELVARINALPGVELQGLQIHLGSQLFETEPFARSVAVLAEKFRAYQAGGMPLKFINVGGGYGIQYEDGQGAFPLERWVEAIGPVVKETGARLLLEPGRSVSGPNGMLLSRVIYTKEGAGKDFYITDAGMNDLLRPSLYDAWHHIMVLRDGRIYWNGLQNDSHRQADLVGPICESGDFIAKGRRIPALQRDDVVVVLSAGAYGAVMSSRYNSRSLTPEVLVDGGRFSLIRRRETFEEMVSSEIY